MNNNRLLIEKVTDLFMKFGIKSITMEDIAHELGISKKTLYQIVSDKKELVELILKNYLDKIRLKADQIKNGHSNAIEEMISILRLIFEFISNVSLAASYDLKKYHNKLYERVRLAYNEIFKNLIVQNINKGKQENLYRKEIDEDIFSAICILQAEKLPVSELMPIETYTSEAYAVEIIELVLNGIVNDEGREIYKKVKSN